LDSVGIWRLWHDVSISARDKKVMMMMMLCIADQWKQDKCHHAKVMK
jgi:hypothetical protein